MKTKILFFFLLSSLILFILFSIVFAQDISSGELRAGGFCCVDDLQCSQYSTTKSCASDCLGNCEIGSCYYINKCISNSNFINKYYWIVKSKSISIWYPPIEYTKIILGFQEPNSEEGFKGIFLKDSFWFYFLIGLLAGLWIWIAHYILEFFRVLKERSPLDKDKLYFKEEYLRWFNLISGRIWKIFIIGMFFAIIIQIPLLGRILQVITLDLINFKSNFFELLVRSLIFSFIIGFGPALYEYYSKIRLETKYQKGANDLRKIKTMGEVLKK